jgi:hypothetical protein
MPWSLPEDTDRNHDKPPRIGGITTDRGEPKSLKRISVHCHFTHQKSFRNAVGMNLGLRGERPATNSPRHEKTFDFLVQEPRSGSFSV